MSDEQQTYIGPRERTFRWSILLGIGGLIVATVWMTAGHLGRFVFASPGRMRFAAVVLGGSFVLICVRLGMWVVRLPLPRWMRGSVETAIGILIYASFLIAGTLYWVASGGH